MGAEECLKIKLMAKTPPQVMGGYQPIDSTSGITPMQEKYKSENHTQAYLKLEN